MKILIEARSWAALWGLVGSGRSPSMPTLVEKAAALRADFGLDEHTPIPDVVSEVAAASGISVEGLPTIVEKVNKLFSALHEEELAATIVQGVPVDIPVVAVGVPTSSAAGDSTPLHSAISGAIRIGAPAFNHGDHHGCYFIYRRTAEECVARLSDSAVSDALRAALERAATQATSGGNHGRSGPTQAAWTMRERTLQGVGRRQVRPSALQSSSSGKPPWFSGWPQAR